MSRRRAGRFSFARLWLQLAAGLAWASPALPAYTPSPPEFGVRTMVFDSAPSTAHGRVYSILSVQMFSSDPRKMPPVDEDSLMSQVCHELDSHGFRPVVKGQNPEILITVHYGRAWLRNPYLSDKGDPVTDGISSLAGLERKPNMDVIGPTTRYIDSLTPGYEARIQKAAAEKLYVRLTGWGYPADAKAKARMLWQTTVVLDDPDRWNLNAVAGSMLAAGAPYFDREIEERELEVHPPTPQGHVNVGVAQVVEPPAPKTAPSTLPAGPASRDEAGPPRKFDVPAGNAVLTLQEFSRQSGQEIIYPIDQVRTIRTNGVNGELGALTALERMLAGTGLAAVQDEKTGALAVRPASRRDSPAPDPKVTRD